MPAKSPKCYAVATGSGGVKRRRAAPPPAARASKCTTPKAWTAYFDGGSRGNPGIAGSGAVVYIDGVEVASAVQTCRNKCTNNEAECIGALLAVRLLHALLNAVLLNAALAGVGALPTHITIHGDSKLIIQQVTGQWRVHAPNLVGPVTELRACAAALATSLKGIALEWVFVRRALNKRADELSNVAMDGFKEDAKVWPWADDFSRSRLVSLAVTPRTYALTGGRLSGAAWSAAVEGAAAYLPGLPATKAMFAAVSSGVPRTLVM
jgi:ribonuclease HI